MAEFLEQIPVLARGYFRTTEQVVDATGLKGAYDFTLNFSPPEMVPGTLVSRTLPGAGGAGGPGAFAASDPTGAVSLFDAITKQLGLKFEQRKHEVRKFVLDHIEQGPPED